MEAARFPIFIVISYALFVVVMTVSLRTRRFRQFRKIVLVGLLVVVAGMLVGKYGNNIGLPWWLYYSIPVLMTVLLPPIFFKMTKIETVTYIPLILVSAPILHLLFSFFIGWNDYMPFIKIKPVWSFF